MDIKSLKLHIINHIVETEDPVLLQTILKLLELNTTVSALSELSELSHKDLKTKVENPTVQILQQDIDDIFEIK